MDWICYSLLLYYIILFSEHLSDTTKVLGWSRVWDFVSGKQEITSLGQRDPFQNWRFTPLYKDPGLAGFMSGSLLLEFLCNAFNFASNPDGMYYLFKHTFYFHWDISVNQYIWII